MDKTIKIIFPNGFSKNKMQDVKSIYEFIVKNIRYSSVDFRNSGLIPQKPSTTIATKLGDCKDLAVLFKALCAKIDVDLNIILVSSRFNGKKQLEIPSIEFNHCMALLELDNKKMFVELTTDLNGFASIHPYSLGAKYLEIGNTKESKIETINTKDRSQNQLIRNSRISFEIDKMIVDKTYKVFGSEASFFRAKVKNLDDDEEEEVFHTMLPNEFPNSKLISYSYDTLTNVLVDSVKYNFKFEIGSPFSSIAGFSVFRIPYGLTKTGVGFMQMKEKKYTLCLWKDIFDFDYEEEKIEVEFPQGKELVQVPQDVKVDNDLLTYSLTFKNLGNKCEITRSTQVKVAEVEPKDFLKLKESVNKMMEAESTQLALQDVKEKPKESEKKKGKKK